MPSSKKASSKKASKGKAPSIMASVQKMKTKLKASRKKAQSNARLAVVAIQSGLHSTAWETYMKQFASTPEQLMRLKATDGTLGDESFDRKRAYLVSTAVCGSTTTDDFGMTVNTIDEGLGGGCAGN